MYTFCESAAAGFQDQDNHGHRTEFQKDFE